MSLKCVNLESSLRIATDGTFHPCCVAKESQFRDESGKRMNIQMCATRVQTSRTPGSQERVGARPLTARGHGSSVVEQHEHAMDG